MIESSIRGGRQALLERQVAESIKRSSMTLDTLHEATGIARAKLGRMRLGKAPVTVDEAETVFEAVRLPSRALFMLACLGEDRPFTPETMAYIEGLMTAMPKLLDTLNDFGSALNPKWAQGSAHHLGVLMAAHVERKLLAEAFAPSPNPSFDR